MMMLVRMNNIRKNNLLTDVITVMANSPISCLDDDVS